MWCWIAQGDDVAKTHNEQGGWKERERELSCHACSRRGLKVKVQDSLTPPPLARLITSRGSSSRSSVPSGDVGCVYGPQALLTAAWKASGLGCTPLSPPSFGPQSSQPKVPGQKLRVLVGGRDRVGEGQTAGEICESGRAGCRCCVPMPPPTPAPSQPPPQPRHRLQRQQPLRLAHRGRAGGIKWGRGGVA